MTVSQLHREVADLVERVERLQTENETLKSELQATKAKVPTEDKEWFSNSEAAKFIGRSEAFLNKDRLDHDEDGKAKTPLIPFMKCGHRTVRYQRNDLLAYFAARKIKGGAKK